MYFGIITAISLPVGGTYIQLNSLWPTFFIITIPAMLTSWLGYFLGHKELKLLAAVFNKQGKNDTASQNPKK
jgi:membrane protein DedA with SNARE-associated domain